jgi:hypothetical protein
LFAIRSSPGSTFNVQLFVVNFNFSFSIGLRFQAGRYKIPAQQQALPVSGHANGDPERVKIPYFGCLLIMNLIIIFSEIDSSLILLL